MSLLYTKTIDNRPTMAEWPIRIRHSSEFPDPFKQQALEWINGNFDSYTFVYAPVRRSSAASFAYLFGYGQQKILFLKEVEGQISKITLNQKEIVKISVKRELLNAELTICYQTHNTQKTFSLSYVPSVYYLYDPFLNWMLGLESDFSVALAEKEHPRPQKLYQESLAMYNLSLGAYRLGDSFLEYSYSSKIRKSRFMPWKKSLEEWLKIPMSRGTFQLHSFKYLTEYDYILR